MKAVSNAGPLIHLSWLGRLELLYELFDVVVVPGAVRREVLEGRLDAPGLSILRQAFSASLIQTTVVAHENLESRMPASLHRGEIEAISLAEREHADILLLDDRVARNEAMRRGLPITGTIGLLHEARERGIIPAVIPLLEELRSRGFRVSSELIERIRREETAR